MKLSNFISDVGRIVAYYPKLKLITGSTTATILLSQFIYWQDKTNDGWIWKDGSEIEEETGLTMNEQRTAKRLLSMLGLLEIEIKKLDHTSRYKVNLEKLNQMWEDKNGKKPVKKEVPAVPEIVPELTPEIILEGAKKIVPEVVEESPLPASVPMREGRKLDLVDATLFFAQTPAMRKIKEIDAIREKIHLNLHINPDNKDWEAFIEHAWKRETKNKEPFDKFIEWAIESGFNPIYWTPKKMITKYPQAYINTHEVREDKFLAALPDVNAEDEAVSMPRELKLKKDY